MFLKNQKTEVLDLTLFLGCPEGSFTANMTSPGYFYPIGEEKSDLLAGDGGR